jgi:hypothetical protein
MKAKIQKIIPTLRCGAKETEDGGWQTRKNAGRASRLPANWSDSGGVTNTNGTNDLSITPPTGNLFFRLMKP